MARNPRRILRFSTNTSGSYFSRGVSQLLPWLRLRMQYTGHRTHLPVFLDASIGVLRKTATATLGMPNIATPRVTTRRGSWPVVAFGVPLDVSASMMSARLALRPADGRHAVIDLLPCLYISYEPDRFLETGVTTWCVEISFHFLTLGLHLSAQRTYLTREEERQQRIFQVTLPRLSPKRLLRRL